METITVKKTEMELLQALANANMEVGKIKENNRKQEVPVIVTEIKEEKPVEVPKKKTIEFSEIDSKSMEALKSLASTNLEVSKAKELLFKFRQEQGEYVKEREEKVLARIQEIIQESSVALNEALENYESIQSLSRESSQFAIFLSELFTEFTELRETFDEMTAQWDETVTITENQLAEVKKQIKIDQVQIKNDQIAIATEKDALQKERRKIQDDRETIIRTIERLKTNKI